MEMYYFVYVLKMQVLILEMKGLIAVSMAALLGELMSSWKRLFG